MSRLKTTFVVFAVAAVFASSASAAPLLMNSDFRTSGDGLLVTDTATGLEWLSPYFTRNVGLASVLGGYQNLVTTEGFHVADAETVRSMITTNFGNVTTAYPGDATGYAAASDFFHVFGLNDPMTCGASTGSVNCPRTQGMAVTGNQVTQLGLIQFGSAGWMIDAGVGAVAQFTYVDRQLGTWLVRDGAVDPESVPEPATLLLMGTGAAAVFRRVRRRAIS